MKKVVISILLFFVFFLKIDNVKAITGYYTYDINTIKLVTVSGKKYLQLTGWAFITNGHGNIHNVQPTFTMYLEGKKEDGTVVGKSVTYGDTSMANKLDKRKFSDVCADPNDYSKGYFSKYVNDAGDTVNYPSVSECKNINRNRVDVLNGNSLAININFSFYIPLADIIDLGKKDATRMYMHLVSELPGGTITVYGRSVATQSAKRDITIGIQDSRVSSTLNSQIKTASNGQIRSIDFYDKVKEITVITASRAQGRPTDRMDTKSYYYRRDSDGEIVTMSGVIEGYQTLYYYSEEDAGEVRATYTVLNNKKVGEITYSPKALTTLAAAHNPVYVYPVLTSIGGPRCWSNNYCLVNGGSTIAWIPAYWIKPIKNMATYIKIDIDPCAEFNDNPDDKYCCLHPEKYPKGSKEERCCYTPEDPTCPTEPCSQFNDNPDAKYCCLHPEEYPEGSKEQTCCYDPDDPICAPTVDPCDDIEDATKHYCCHYGSDPICSNGGDTDEYPTYDPENKPGMCSEAGNTKVEFKFPAEGWSDQIVKNTACIVSCQETLAATFEPVKYVSKAGMGFKYPVDINSARSCAASYNNEYWQSELEKAAKAAKVAYDKMNEYLDIAKSLDTTCGTKTVPHTSLPSCPSPYTDSRSGQTCKCNLCGTCYNWNWDSEGCQYPSYSCFDWDTHTWGVCEGIKYGCFVREEPPYGCESSTYLSCPSIEGKSTSYNSSQDWCEVALCNNSRDYWQPAQDDIADALTIASAQKAEYVEQMTYISKLLGDRNTCDNFPTLYPYNGAKNATIDLSIDNIDNQDNYEITAQNVVNNDTVYEYARQRTGTTYTVYNNRVSVYSPDRNLVGDNKSTATNLSGTYYDYSTNPTHPIYYDFWNRKATAYYRFEFENDWYVQKYTGDLSLTGGTAYLYGGRYAYTDYNVLSGDYGIELNINNLGPDIPGVSNNLWSIDPFTCTYNVNNVTFPPNEDENHDIYGNVGFMYRQISLTDPFPNRQPRQNWINKEYLIVNNGYSVYSNDPLYKIVLNPLTMQQIRDVYGTNYDSYNASNPYRSILVQEYINRGIITKRVVH